MGWELSGIETRSIYYGNTKVNTSSIYGKVIDLVKKHCAGTNTHKTKVIIKRQVEKGIETRN